MPTASYIPTRDQDLTLWINNFNAKLPTHAGTFGISAAQLTSVNNDTMNYNYWLTQSALFKDESQERNAYKDLLKNGPIGLPAGTPPTAPVILPAPVGILPGIVPRIRIIAQYIKNHPNYTVPIGQDLGIIAPEVVVDLPNLKPILTLVKLGAGINVKWTKGVAGALRIEKQVVVTAGPPPVWNLLAIDTEPDYLDTSPITVPQTWNYRAIYLINDEMVGQWSDVASISVG